MSDIVIAKKHCNQFALDLLQHNVARANSKPLRHCVNYTGVVVSPMFVTVTAGAPSVTAHSTRVKQLPPAPLRPLQQFNERQLSSVMFQVVTALSDLHKHKIVHGHLCSDFVRVGLSGTRVVAEVSHHVIPPQLLVRPSETATSYFRLAAPEILASQPYGFPADVWGCGALLIDLVQGRSNAALETADLIESGVMMPSLGVLSPGAVSFAVTCLKEDPTARPTLIELMQHPFLTQRPEPTAVAASRAVAGSAGGGALAAVRRLSTASSASEDTGAEDSEDDDDDDDEDNEEADDEDEEESDSDEGAAS